MINFHPNNSGELKPRISVIGVGGAGGNAVNNMIQAELEGVDFIVANTDAQALSQSRTDRRIQLGAAVTQGLGAGARPEVGRAAAEETLEQILSELAGSNMVFITAGMGGGTGTGAAPVIARAARENGILTVGVVTKPFHFEGQHRMRLADAGIEEMSAHVDTLIIIPNQNLFRVASERTTFADAFKMADDVLYSGVRGVTDLMIMPGLINLDFADIRTIMSEMGKAMMGTGEAEGEKRALEAAEAAINNPLLEDISMKGAKGVLINITGGKDITLFEVDEAANRVRDEVDPEANIIVGSTFDEKLEGKMRVSVVATGIEALEQQQRPTVISLVETKRAPAPRSIPTPAPQERPVGAFQAQAAMQSAFKVQPRQPEPAPEPEASVAQNVAMAEEPAALSYEEQAIDRLAKLRQAANAARMDRMEPTMAPKRMQVDAQPSQGTLRIDMPEPRMQTTAQPRYEAQAIEDIQPEAEPAREVEEAPRRGGFLSRLTGHHAKPQPAPQPAREPSMSSESTSYRPAASTASQPTRLSAGDRLPNSRGSEDDLLDIPAFLRRQAN